MTPPGGDEGIDVHAENLIAQAKCYNESNKVGVDEIQRLAGIKDGTKVTNAFFFTTSSYTKGAIKWASLTGIELFRFDFHLLGFVGVTGNASAYCRGEIRL